MPKVSVIIPAYNQMCYLSTTVQSVLDQSFDDWECIIVDDGATDDTPHIADELARRDGRIRVIHQANGGLSAARNTGIKHSKSPYLVFLDSDDVLLPTMLEECWGALEAEVSAAGVTCRVPMINASGALLWSSRRCRIEIAFNVPIWRVFNDHPLAVYLQGNLFPPVAGMWRAQLVLQAGGFDVSLRSLEDFDLWLKLIEQGGSILRLESELCYYRRMPGSMSTNRRRMYENGRRVLDGYFLRSGSGEELVRRAAYFSQAAPFYPDVTPDLAETPESLHQLFAASATVGCASSVRLRMLHALSATLVPQGYLLALGASAEILVVHQMAKIRNLLKCRMYGAVIRAVGALVVKSPINGTLAIFEFLRSKSLLTLKQAERALVG